MCIWPGNAAWLHTSALDYKNLFKFLLSLDFLFASLENTGEHMKNRWEFISAFDNL